MTAAASFIEGLLHPIAAELRDPSVSEILINGHLEIFVERGGRLERSSSVFASDDELLSALRAVSQSLGRRFGATDPILEGRLPDGSRIEALLPPLVTRGAHVAIRRHRATKITMQRLLEIGSIEQSQYEFLRAALLAKKNVLVAGGTGSGKTSLLNCLASLIPPEERIVTIEDARELMLQQPHVVSLEARPADEEGEGAVGIPQLFRATLRLRPDRIVIGELRGEEAFELIQAMTSGHGGSMSTLHASSPRDALRRLESMALERGLLLPLAALREQIASAVHVLVQVDRLSDGSRRVTQVARVLGLGPQGEYEISPASPGAEVTPEAGHGS